MSATTVDVEEIETTRSEKLLAVVLAIFLLIGGIWAYTKIDDPVRDAVAKPVVPTPAERAALKRSNEAFARLDRATHERARARGDLELRREAYRTALDEGRRAPGLARRYRAAQARFQRAERDVRAARRELRQAEPAARQAQRRLGEESERRHRRYELFSFSFRLAFVLATIAFGYWLLGRLRKRGSRYLPAGLAFVGFAAVLALVMAGDYITDYIDPLDLGPLVLSLFGIALTLVAFAALQRYLARRVPHRRVRKRECPFCGYPVGANPHCEGCGREVIAACATCGESRRVGTLHCGVCGAT